ncbi:MAG: hypothetical protein QNJ41_25175 [Xenococcaceae cyanobacterium MO_188.B32]|nr:hypothetical protein [Xenococcaceae cyanobacterium MO_188.B32]
MAIIVKHRRTGNEYIWLGINGGGEQTSLPSRFLNDLFPREKPKHGSLVTICDARGNIFSCYLEDLVVVEIDGKKPEDILPEPVIPSINDDFEDDDREGWQQGNGEPASSLEDSAREDRSSQPTDEFNNEEDWI